MSSGKAPDRTKARILFFKVLRIIAITLSTAFFYSLAERVAQLELFTQIPGVSLVYPTTAVAIIAFYFFGPMAALGVILGCIASPWSAGTHFTRGVIKGLIHSVEGFLPFLVISRRGADSRLYRQNTLFAFLLFGIVAGTFLDSVFGNIYQFIRYNILRQVPDPIPMAEIPIRFFSWWTSDLLAAICIALPIILLVRPHLSKIPPRIRKFWLHPVHSNYFPRPLDRPRIQLREAILVSVLMLTFFVIFFITFPVVIVGTSWVLMILIFPILHLAFRGGMVSAVLCASFATYFSFGHIFTHYDPAGGVVPIVNAVATLIFLNFLGILAGFFNDGVQKNVAISERVQRYTESLMGARSHREIFSHLASALIDVLGLKRITIQEENRTTNIPEDVEVSGEEKTLHFFIPPTTVTCSKWDRDIVSVKDNKTANNLVQQARISLKNLDLTQNLHDKIEELKIVFATTSHTLETLDMNVLLDKVTRTLKTHFELSIAKIFIYDHSARLLRLRTSSGVDPDLILFHEVPPGKGMLGKSFAEETIVYLPDITEIPDHKCSVEGIISETAIPLRVEEGVIGVFLLQCYKRDPFSSRDLTLLTNITTNLAFAIHQADLHGALSKAHELLQTTYFDTVETLCNAIEAKDNYTEGHVERTATYATELAINLGMEEDEITTLRLGAMLHDIGKIGVPEAILQKPQKLERDERELMKKHTSIGVNILKNIDFIRKAIPIIQYHHEWYSGEGGADNFGYPDGIHGKDIPLAARVVAVVDAFDAMTSSRPYRKALTWDEATKRLIIEKGRQFDPEIVDSFMEILINSYNYHPGKVVLQLIELPPLKGSLPDGFSFQEGPTPSFS